MDKRMLQFKLLSYKQALRKAQEKNDNCAIKRWSANIAELQQEIDQADQLDDYNEEAQASSYAMEPMFLKYLVYLHVYIYILISTSYNVLTRVLTAYHAL